MTMNHCQPQIAPSLQQCPYKKMGHTSYTLSSITCTKLKPVCVVYNTKKCDVHMSRHYALNNELNLNKEN